MLIPPSCTLSLASFVVDGDIGLGVPIGTDAFIQHFVKDKCQAIMEDVDKTTSKTASSTTRSYGVAKLPGCNISTATYSSRTKTCYNNNTLITRSLYHAASAGVSTAVQRLLNRVPKTNTLSLQRPPEESSVTLMVQW